MLTHICFLHACQYSKRQINSGVSAKLGFLIRIACFLIVVRCVSENAPSFDRYKVGSESWGLSCQSENVYFASFRDRYAVEDIERLSL